MNHPHLELALHTVANACTVARSIQQDLDRVREITKDDRSPVTVADFAVQAIVALALGAKDADFRMVGEEAADALRGDDAAPVRDEVVRAVQRVHPDATVDAVLNAIDAGAHDGTGAAYWALDPIDGTKGFLRGQQYAIALAHLEQGVVQLGVMGCPNLPARPDAPLDQADGAGTMYAAVRGAGSWEYVGADASATPRQIHAAVVGDNPIRTCESVEAAHSDQSESAGIVTEMGGESAPVRLDSQCKYAVVARGQADAYLRLPTRPGYVEKIWDHAAGSLVATEAGAVVSDVTGAPLDFTHGRRLEVNRGVICAARDIHAPLIDVITRRAAARS